MIHQCKQAQKVCHNPESMQQCSMPWLRCVVARTIDKPSCSLPQCVCTLSNHAYCKLVYENVRIHSLNTYKFCVDLQLGPSCWCNTFQHSLPHILKVDLFDIEKYLENDNITRNTWYKCGANTATVRSYYTSSGSGL